MAEDPTRTPEDLFRGFPEGLAICQEVARVVDSLGGTSMAVTKSQVAFRRRRGFAYVWRPGQYVANDVPAVLSIALPHEVTSDRFKSVAHPAPTTWMHHLELTDVGEVDAQVRAWLEEAWASAG